MQPVPLSLKGKSETVINESKESRNQALEAVYCFYAVINFDAISRGDAHIPRNLLSRRYDKLCKRLMDITIGIDDEKRPFLTVLNNKKDPHVVLKEIFENTLGLINKPQSFILMDNFLPLFNAVDNKNCKAHFIGLKCLSPCNNVLISNVTDNGDKHILLCIDPLTCKLRVVHTISHDASCQIIENAENNRQLSDDTFIEKMTAENWDLHVFKYFYGGDLVELVNDEEKHKAMPWELLGKLGLAMVEALQQIHQKNIVHRDIKLDNCVFKIPEKDKPIKVSWIDRETSCKEGADEQYCGTRGYLPPEVIINRMELPDRITIIDRRSDIYSLGLTFHPLFMHVISSDVFQWIDSWREKQAEYESKIDDLDDPSDDEEICILREPDLDEAWDLATNLKNYNNLLEKHLTGVDYFILRLLHPDYKKRPDINETLELYKEHVYNPQSS